MSRIGKKPIIVPPNVEVKLSNSTIIVKGPKGVLEKKLPPYVEVKLEDKSIKVEVAEDAPKRTGKAFWGLARALINNMVEGVTRGYTRSLDLVGVGYRAKLQGNKLSLNVGFTHPVVVELPEGIKAEIRDTGGQKENQIVLFGVDKELVGQLAAKLRAIRPPDPYKGKGIRYTNEVIRQKAGKTGKAGK